MLILSTRHKTRVINPKQIVHMELKKQKTTAFVEGEVIKGKVKVEDLHVREPWTVVIVTSAGKYYSNHSNFESALDDLVNISIQVDTSLNKKDFKKKVRKVYARK